MPFTKIVPADLQGKGVIGQPPVPGLSVNEMQESVEQVVREVAIPAVNRLIDELESTSAGENVGMEIPAGMPPETPKNVQGVVQSHIENTENPHGVTAEQVGAYTKAETDAQIDKKVQAIGAADMSKAEFATSGEYGVVDKAKAAESADNAASSDDGVKLYTHSKSGTVHEFSGTGPNGRAKMTADVEAGDTFTVNGAPVTAYMGPNDATDVMAGSEWNGKWVSFILDGSTLNFSGGPKETGLVLLWTNPNPTSDFTSQTVPVDLSPYDFAVVECYFDKSSSPPYDALCNPIQVGNRGILMLALLDGTGVMARACTVTEAGVNFSASQQGDKYVIPYKIFGLRG